MAIAEDFTSDVWLDRPMLATLSGGVLVLGWTVVFVNQYLAAREHRRWVIVAASAMEDLGRVAQTAWMQPMMDLRLTTTSESQVRLLQGAMMSPQDRRH